MIKKNLFDFFFLFTVAVYLVCLGLYFVGLQIHQNVLVDDAFITFRYAQNIAGGHGIVWNIGGEPTEGFTSPLQVLLLVPIEFLKMDPLKFMQVLSILLNGVGIPVLCFAAISMLDWYQKSWLKRAAYLIPCVWLVSQSMVIHTMSGMETSLVTFLYAAYAVFILWVTTVFRGELTQRARITYTILLVAFAFIISLSRSEAGAIAVLGLCSLFWNSSTRKTALIALGGFFGVLTLYLVWKLFYYGYLLPNPFYHKVAPEGSGRLPGLRNVASFVNHHLFLFVFAAATWVLSPPRSLKSLSSFELLCAAGTIFYLLFFLRVSHIMGYDFRFVWHCMPLVLLFSIVGLWRLDLSSDEADPNWLSRFAFCAGTGAILLGLCMRLTHEGAVYWLLKNPFNPTVIYEDQRKGYYAHWQIGQTLQELDLDYSTVVNGTEAGIIPYYAETKSIDLVGLNDNTITRGSEEEREAYIAAQKLDVTYSVSTTGALDDTAPSLEWKASAPEQVREFEQAQYLKRVEEYTYAGSYHWDVDERRQYFNMWVRNDHPRSEEIIDALKANSDGNWPDKFLYGPIE